MRLARGFELTVPGEHPRAHSLQARERIVNAAEQGLLADSALIAHGRGEAFDYLLGEKTSKPAENAIKHALKVLINAARPVISVNGNTVALAGQEVLILAAMLGAGVEVNLFYRTPERIQKLVECLEEKRSELIGNGGIPPSLQARVNRDEWKMNVRSIPILGAEPDGLIPGLKGARANACKDGILPADVVLVPIEDGARLSLIHI